MTAPELYFEDFPAGAKLEFGAYKLSREEIVAFARAFDPQPFHLDEDAGKRSMLGGLAASGWHACALLMRLNYEGYLRVADGRGAPGVDEVKWLKPIRPGATLSVRAEVLSARVSKSKPSIGLLQIRSDLHDDSGDRVTTQTNFVMMGRRGAEHPTIQIIRPAQAPASPPAEDPDLVPAFSELQIGQRIVLGACDFPEKDVIAFARAYDPQPFHVDPVASQNGPFGALAASGWHTAAAWMRALVDAKQRSNEARVAAGGVALEAGPSPGFVNLRWIKPVYAGDRITFDTVTLEKRLTSRPGWGLVRSRNGGVNQHGERVYEFESSSFWKLD